MSKVVLSCSLLLVFAFFSLIFSKPTDGKCTYCVANPKASEELIQEKLDFACGFIPDSCDLIQPGAPCYVPNDLRATASYVFNDWFLGGAECDFDGAEIRTYNDPSHGNCSFFCKEW